MKLLFKRALTFTLVATMLTLTLAGCGEKKDKAIIGNLAISEVENDVIKKGNSDDKESERAREYAKFTLKDFPTLNSMLLEFNSDKIDLFRIPLSTANYLKNNDDGLTVEQVNFGLTYHMAVLTEKSELYNDLNKSIVDLKASGTLSDLSKEYVTDLKGDPISNKIIGNPDGATYVVGISGDTPPLDYVAANGSPAGFNVALLNAISEKTGCNFEVVQLDTEARTTALASGKIDIIFCMRFMQGAALPSEESGLLVTDSYFAEPITFVSRDYPMDDIKKIFGLK